MRVAVVTNQTGDTALNRLDAHAAEQAEVTCRAVVEALRALGHNTVTVEARPTLLIDLQNAAPDAIINIATGYRSKKDQANIAAILDLSGIPFTGSSFRVHVLALYKHLTKFVMAMSEIPTPDFCVVGPDRKMPSRESLAKLPPPWIVKPAAEGSSLGISSESVTADPDKVFALVKELLSRFGPPVLIEEYIDGREFTVGLLGYPEPVVFPVEEIVFKEGAMYTYSVKYRDSVTPVCPADIPPDLATNLQALAKKVFVALDCRDLARVDFRVSADGRPYALEVNTLPGLMPGYSEFPRIAEIAGFDYVTLVKRLLEGAFARKSLH